MARNKVYMALTLVFIFSLLAISMVESRTLTDILEKNKPTIAEASSSLKADSVMANHGKLNGALPRNLRPDALLIKDTKQTSSSRPIRTTDATPVRMKVDRPKPIWLTEYKPAWLVDNPHPIMIGDDNIDVESTQVTDQPPRTSSSGYEEMPRTETSPSIDADSYVVNSNTWSGAFPTNLKVADELSDAKRIRKTDATPTSVANSMMTTSLEPVTNYSQSSVLEEDTKTGEELAEYIKSTQVINQHEGTATTETELTPVSVSTSTMISSQAESMNYTQSSVIEEFPETNTESTENVKTVPRPIGSHVFFGKMVSGSEMYNMTTDEYYNQIYPTHNCDVFLIGKLLKVADTPHNRMVFAKFAEEDTDSTSDDSREKDVPIDN